MNKLKEITDIILDTENYCRQIGIKLVSPLDRRKFLESLTIEQKNRVLNNLQINILHRLSEVYYTRGK